MSRFATVQIDEAADMSEQIYEHLPKWRRIIRDLAAEAGLRKFMNPADEANRVSSAEPESCGESQTEAER